MHVQRLRACESPDYDEEKEKWKDRDHRVRIARRVVEDPGGFRDFKHAGWGRAAAPLFFTWSLGGGEEAGQFKLDDTGTEALLFGRVTYEEFAAAWSARDDELADKFNSLPKYVISSTLEDADWNNTTVLRGNLM